MSHAEILDVINDHRKTYFAATLAGITDEDYRKAIEASRELGIKLTATADRALKSLDKAATK